MSQHSFITQLPLPNTALKFLSFSDTEELEDYLRSVQRHPGGKVGGCFFRCPDNNTDTFTICIVRNASAKGMLFHEAVHATKALYAYAKRRSLLPANAQREECIAYIDSAIALLGLHWIEHHYKEPSAHLCKNLSDSVAGLLNPEFWKEYYEET
jgi:hypothetical protein